MYFTANPGTPLNWDLFLPCALHTLIVTAMIFADILTPIIYRKSPRDKTCPCSMRQREAGRMPHCFLWHTENAYLQGMIAADNESPSMLWAELSRPLAVQLSPRKVRMERALLTSWYCLGSAESACRSSSWPRLACCQPSLAPGTAETLSHPSAMHISATRWQNSE